MKKITLNLFLLISGLILAQTTNPDLLVTIQKASQAEIDAYNTTELELGMLVYNTDENRIYEYTTQGWLELLTASNVYVGAFQINRAGTVTVNNIPFRPSQIIFKANANIESENIDTNNGTDDGDGPGAPNFNQNERGIANSFGVMNGFARRNNNNVNPISQQAIFIGGTGNSIDNISRYASDQNCIGVRFGNQKGRSLGKIEASLTKFNSDGFELNVVYTNGVVSEINNDPSRPVQPTDINNEGLLVLFTAYR